jgi:sugar lactone lactonase YvrE
MKAKIYVFMMMISFSLYGFSETVVDEAQCQRITTAAGPHSLIAEGDSLWLSTHPRRNFERAGNIQQWNVETKQLKTMLRKNEPKDLVFRPHHFMFITKNKQKFLYIINHDAADANSKQHSILIYQLNNEVLSFVDRLQSDLLTSPNHLWVMDNQTVYVVNDRQDGSSVMEFIWRSRKANVVMYRPEQGWKVVIDKLSFPNGIFVKDNQMYIAQTFGGVVESFTINTDGSVSGKSPLLEKPLLDGVFEGDEPNTILSISHAGLAAFMRHKSSASNKSAATIYKVNTKTKKATIFLQEKGDRISGLSSVQFLKKGEAYYAAFGQSFDDFIMVCPMLSK